MSEALWMTTGAASTPVGVATVTAVDDTLTLTAHGLVDGVQVRTSAPVGGAIGALVPGAPYFVAAATTDTLQLRPSPGAPVMTFDADGTVTVSAVDAEYEPAELRRLQTALMWPGASGAQTVSGIRPGNVIAEMTGSSTLTVYATTGVAHPGGAPWMSTDGAYVWSVPEQALTVTAADGAQDRLDRLVVRIQDTAVDSSGERQAVPVIKTGVPAVTPTAPTVDAGEVDAGTILVHAGLATPSEYTPPLADLTAVGGTRPVATFADLPTVGLYAGMRCYVVDEAREVSWNGSDWVYLVPVVEVLEDVQTANITGFTDTGTPVAGSPICGVSFVAPPSEIVFIDLNASIQCNTADTAQIGVMVRTGATVGSGSIFYDCQPDGKPKLTTYSVANNGLAATVSYKITGLTAGVTYNAHSAHWMSAGNGDIFWRTLTLAILG